MSRIHMARVSALVLLYASSNGSIALAAPSGKVDDARCRLPAGQVPDGTWFGGVSALGTDSISFDVMCLFDGEEAQRAAQEDHKAAVAGYYIRNQSTRVRQVPVAATVSVTWLPDLGAGTTSPIAYADWSARRATRSLQPPTTIRVEAGKVVEICEKFLPAAGPTAAPPTSAATSCGSCAAPKLCRLGRCVAQGTVVAAAKRGDGPKDIGMVDMDESESEAPNSLVVSERDGRVYMLDHVNSRLQVFRNGKHERAFALPRGFYTDLARLPDGKLVVEETVDHQVFLLAPDGALLQTWTMAALGLGNAKLGLDYKFSPQFDLAGRDDGVWFKHAQRWLHILDADGRPLTDGASRSADVTSVDARWSLDVSVERSGAGRALRLRISEAGGSTNEASLYLTDRFATILEAGIDRAGNASILTHISWAKDDTRWVYLHVFSPKGELLRRAELPPYDERHTAQHYAFISPEGGVYYLDTHHDRIRVLAY